MTIRQDEEAETLFLACVAIDPGLLPLYAHKVEDIDFAVPRNRLFWGGFIAAFVRRERPEIDVMRRWLESQAYGNGTAYQFVGEDYLRHIYDRETLHMADPPVINTKKAEFFMQRILDAADRSLRAEMAERLREAAERVGVEADGVWNEVFSAVLERRKTRAHVRQIAAYYPRIKASVEDWFRGLPGNLVSSGYPTLDRLLGGGLQPKRLIVLGGAPNSGKTTLALNIMSAMAENGIGVGISSIEMAGEDLLMLLACRNIHIPYSALRSGDYATTGPKALPFQLARNKNVERKFIDEMARLSKLPLYCDDRHEAISAARIYSSVLMMSAELDPRLWAIDYAELIADSGRGGEWGGGDSDNEALRIAGIFKASKNLARLLGITVMLLSQITKDVKHRPDGKPQMGDIKYAPPAIPDTIWLNWYPGGMAAVGEVNAKYVRKIYGEMGITCDPDELIVIQAKARYAQRTMARLGYDAPTSRIIDPLSTLAVPLAEEAF